MEHSFDIDIAKEYGIPAAILLKHIYYWVEKNRANYKHLIEGEYWTYCSVKAFGELFPYMSAKVIRTGLTKLEEGELIKTGCFNTQIYDRTKWYTLTPKGKSLCQNGKRSLDKKANVFNQKGEPIPYKEPYKETYNKSSKEDYNSHLEDDSSKNVYPEIVELWNTLEPYGIKKIRSIASGSKRHVYLRTRLKQYGYDSFAEIVENIKESDFLQGRVFSKSPFVVYFDWVILPNNYPKVLEGNYNQRKPMSEPRAEMPTGLEKPKGGRQ